MEKMWRVWDRIWTGWNILCDGVLALGHWVSRQAETHPRIYCFILGFYIAAAMLTEKE